MVPMKVVQGLGTWTSRGGVEGSSLLLGSRLGFRSTGIEFAFAWEFDFQRIKSAVPDTAPKSQTLHRETLKPYALKP